MVTITALILPILLSTALVWVASALIWTVLPWHKKDFAGLPDEDSALASLRAQNLPAGQYVFPHATSPAEMKEPGMREKYDEGPAGFMTVLPRGVPAMGKAMALSAVFYIVIGVAVAYVAGRTLAPGAEYMAVFRLTGTIAWLAHGAAFVQDAIWFGRPWSSIGKALLDSFIYALLTAGAFAGLWPDTV